MTFGMVLPVHNAFDKALEARRCISKSHGSSDILVIDDASREEFPPLRNTYHVRNNSARGYAHHINTAVLWALDLRLDTLVIINSDTVFTPTACENLVSAMKGYEAIMAGPALSAAGSGQGSDPEVTSASRLELSNVESYRTAQVYINKGETIYQSRFINSLNGAFFALDVKAVLKFGFFDERFGRGSFEEHEWSTRVREMAGRENLFLYVPTVCVYHYKNASFEDSDVDSEKQWTRNKELFNHKKIAKHDWAQLSYPREIPEWIE